MTTVKTEKPRRWHWSRALARPLARWVILAGAVAGLASVVAGSASSQGEGVRSRGTIAFLRHPEGALKADVGGPSLFVTDANGTGLRRLTSRDSQVHGFAWASDGSRIAYTDRGSLWLVGKDGRGRRRLFSRASVMGFVPSWSPDGKRIALFAGEAKNLATGFARIYIVPVDGGAPQRLAPEDVRDPSWSPRGDKIAYASGAGEIKSIRADGSLQHALHLYNFGMPTWSPDGRHLGLVGCRRTGARCVARYAGIYAADEDGSNLHPVTVHAYNEYGFRWSPDSTEILYGKENDGGIYVIGADGRNDRRITTDSPPGIGWGALTWSPDGRSIAYVTHRSGNGDIYVIDADGHDQTRLTSSAETDSDPAWAPR